jgi:hypothetical protein
MKKTAIFLLVAPALLLAAIAPAVSQTYTVVKTRGKVALQSNGKVLKRSTKFKAAPLKFSNLKDLLVVLDEKDRAFLFYPDSSLKKYREKALPPIGTRPGMILNKLQLSSFLRENDSLLLLGGRFSLVLGKQEFPLDSQHFFYMEYTWRGQIIPKMLGFRDDTLLIGANDLYKIDGVPINPAETSERCKLWYYDVLTQESVPYPDHESPIFIINPDEGNLREELALLLSKTPDAPQLEKTRKANIFLRALYGTAGDWELEQMLKELNR